MRRVKRGVATATRVRLVGSMLVRPGQLIVSVTDAAGVASFNTAAPHLIATSRAGKVVAGDNYTFGPTGVTLVTIDADSFRADISGIGSFPFIATASGFWCPN